MRRILFFLDIDGVIATNRALDLQFRSYYGFDEWSSEKAKETGLPHPHTSGSHWPFDQEAITYIHSIQRQWLKKGYDVCYVISSAWRTGRSIKELEEIFAMKGLYLCKIIDKTKHRHNDRARGLEIKDWIEENKKDKDIYIVIDDEIDYDIKGHLPDEWLITTDQQCGFTYWHYQLVEDLIIGQI